MKQQDIDKRIGMPDVDKEWAQFEREVIGTNSKSRFRHAAIWTIGIGIAATISLLFVLNTDMEKAGEGPIGVQEVAMNSQQDDTPTSQQDDNVMRLGSTELDTFPISNSKSKLALEDKQLEKRIAQLTIVPTSADMESGHIMRLGSDSLSMAEASLQGLIGVIGDSFPIHFVSKKERKSLPYLWERDTVLVLVNGKEDKDFLRYLSSMSHGSMSNVYDYFFERNQLFLMQSLPSKEVQASSYDPSLFEGRDIRLVVDYLTKPFTSVSQLTPEQIKSRRLTYLRNKYCAGFSKNSNQDYYAPDLYDSPAKERLFGLTAAKCRSYGQQHEYFGPMGSDSHGVYVPLIRDVITTTHDDAWWENGEVCILKDDPRFNQAVNDILQASTSAGSSAVTSGDSIVRLAFIFGGKVAEGQPNDLLSGMQKQLYTKVKTSTFAFNPDADAPSWWWGEAYYSTTSTHQRQLWMHLHSVDKLYAADCPELLSNRRHVEGMVTDEKGAPLAEANVGIGFVTPWDAITTDRNGHFDLWMPFRDSAIRVNHAGYITQQILPTDTVLVIHMKDATKLREVKVLPKKKMEQYQRIE